MQQKCGFEICFLSLFPAHSHSETVRISSKETENGRSLSPYRRCQSA